MAAQKRPLRPKQLRSLLGTNRAARDEFIQARQAQRSYTMVSCPYGPFLRPDWTLTRLPRNNNHVDAGTSFYPLDDSQDRVTEEV